jgi:cyclopropane fatty-acyl-phospholipid synthase-like methyltransferase
MKIWHREAIGGNWDKIGKLQFDFLLKMGLKPDNYLLDLGCGSLRGGVLFIPYLEDKHYYGVEKETRLLEAAEVELKETYNISIYLLFLIFNFTLC